MSDIKFYITKQFGPIPIGHRGDEESPYTYGFGRIIKITIGTTKEIERLDRDNIFSIIQSWLDVEWKHKVLLASNDPLVDQLKTLGELGGVCINVLPEQYNPGVESSCIYAHHNLNAIVRKATNENCWIELVEIWEYKDFTVVYSRSPV